MPNGTPISSLWHSRRIATANHEAKLRRLKDISDRKLRVAFIIVHRDVWKYDGLIAELRNTTWAEPIIIIAPYIAQGPASMREALLQCQDYAVSLGVEFYLDERLFEPDVDPRNLAPILPFFDIVFFSNPHDLTTRHYYRELYLNHLCCYVPYSYGMSYLNFNYNHYNQEFHNCMWRIFVPLRRHFDIFSRCCASGASHVRVAGYPGIHDLLCGIPHSYRHWKNDGRLKVIWAPHHTISMPELQLSHFLPIHEFMVTLKRRYSDHIEWAFRPHPLLKHNLINIAGWSLSEVDGYWREWENDSHISSDDYVGLFANSNAIIHDSASFLVEYLYTGRPALYLDFNGAALGYMNDVGAKAYECYKIARCTNDIEKFLDSLINGFFDTESIQKNIFISSEVLASAHARPELTIINELYQAVYATE